MVEAFGLFLLLFALAALPCRVDGKAVPIVLPDDSHTRLALQAEGVEALKKLSGRVAPVVVIGPFRSGKSFVLNQMLDLPCDEGFSVGHRRHAQTKGIWFWDEPQLVNTANGEQISIIYVDTEGFEAAGKADVYDDRVFALSALLSNVLIYNLPETVKEADIQKLQFAVELAEEFKHRADDDDDTDHQHQHHHTPSEELEGSSGLAAVNTEGSSSSLSLASSSFQIPSLLWLIQRDFLEGRSVEEMVKDALRPVDNPSGDSSVDHLNQIRMHLSSAARNYATLGMCQPHLERTKLCELSPQELDPKYLNQTAQLRSLVLQMVESSTAQEKGPEEERGEEDRLNNRRPALPLAKDATSMVLSTGAELAAHLTKLVAALNKGEIPSVKSVTESFNEDIIRKLVGRYEAKARSLSLPMEEKALTAAHHVYSKDARKAYLRQKFGRSTDTKALHMRIQQVYQWVVDRNRLSSKDTCEGLHMRCSEIMDMLQLMSLPSMMRFDNLYKIRCNGTFESECVGPSKASYRARIQKDYAKERTRFMDAYNQKLLNGVTMASLLGVIVFRFIWVLPLFELIAWGGFLFLEMYLKTHSLLFTDTSHPYWKKFVSIWELVVFNEFYDLNSFTHVLVPLLGVIVVIKSGQKCWQTAKHYYCIRFLLGFLSCFVYAILVVPSLSVLRLIRKICGLRESHHHHHHYYEGNDCSSSYCCCCYKQQKGTFLPYYSYKQS